MRTWVWPPAPTQRLDTVIYICNLGTKGAGTGGQQTLEKMVASEFSKRLPQKIKCVKVREEDTWLCPALAITPAPTHLHTQETHIWGVLTWSSTTHSIWPGQLSQHTGAARRDPVYWAMSMSRVWNFLVMGINFSLYRDYPGPEPQNKAFKTHAGALSMYFCNQHKRQKTSIIIQRFREKESENTGEYLFRQGLNM